MTERRHSRGEDARGVIAVVVAFSAVIVFVLAAFVVDLGLARDTKRQAQNAADASALAAGNVLYTVGKTPHFSTAVAAAKTYAQQNYGVTTGEWASCLDAAALPYKPGGTECISFDDSVLPTAVRVVMPVRAVKTPLARIIGNEEVRISALAHINVLPDTMSRCALCIIGSGPHSLQNGQVEVTGGDIHFNGDVGVGPNGLVSTDGSITVEGTASGSLSSYQPDPMTGQPRIADPLAFMSVPDFSSLTARSDPCLNGPGIYGSFSAGCAMPLAPGLYVITGRWQFTGNENLVAPGVTLYFTCGTAAAPRPCAATGEQGGWLDASGNGTIQLSAPTSGPTKGLAIMYERNNTSQIRLTGNGASQYTGTIYAPRSTLDYRGNGIGTPDSLVVVAGLEFSGNNATMDVEYDGDQNVDMPPTDLHLSR